MSHFAITWIAQAGLIASSFNLRFLLSCTITRFGVRSPPFTSRTLFTVSAITVSDITVLGRVLSHSYLFKENHCRTDPAEQYLRNR